MRTLHVVPAYGRDYKSRKAVEASLLQGDDFTIQDMFSPDDGRYVNLGDLQDEAYYTHLQVRYGQLRKVTIVNMDGL